MAQARAARREKLRAVSKFAPSRANFVPFKTILQQLRGDPRWSTSIINLVGNTVLFVPVGFLVSFVFRSISWRRSLAIGIAVGLSLEGTEGLLRVGVVDVDDVILNAFGVVSGYWVFKLWERRRLNHAAAPRAVGGQA